MTTKHTKYNLQQAHVTPNKEAFMFSYGHSELNDARPGCLSGAGVFFNVLKNKACAKVNRLRCLFFAFVVFCTGKQCIRVLSHQLKFGSGRHNRILSKGCLRLQFHTASLLYQALGILRGGGHFLPQTAHGEYVILS